MPISFGQKFDKVNLRLRLISSLVLIPAVLFLISWGDVAYDLAVILAMCLGLGEWLMMVSPTLLRKIKIAFFVAMLLLLSLGAWGSLGLSLCVSLFLGLFLFLYLRANRIVDAGWLVTGLGYLGAGGLALFYLRHTGTEDRGIFILLYLMAVVWATDVGGYLAGRLIGGPKLCVKISPNKTWAGLGGCVVFAAAAGYGVALAFGSNSLFEATVMGGWLALVAQAGDLFESYIKRRAGKKDSGDIIPGHGGLLDRIDGLLSASIFLALFYCLLAIV